MAETVEEKVAFYDEARRLAERSDPTTPVLVQLDEHEGLRVGFGETHVPPDPDLGPIRAAAEKLSEGKAVAVGLRQNRLVILAPEVWLPGYPLVG